MGARSITGKGSTHQGRLINTGKCESYDGFEFQRVRRSRREPIQPNGFSMRVVKPDGWFLRCRAGFNFGKMCVDDRAAVGLTRWMLMQKWAIQIHE